MPRLIAAFIIDLLVLFGVGLGPALWAFRGTRRLPMALAIGPAVGLSLLTVIGSVLVQNDRPVVTWAVPLTIAAMLFSLLLTTVSLPGIRREPLAGYAVPIAAFVLTAAVMVFPLILGGLSFSILRGNGWDSFNYIATAGYIDHEPLSWVAGKSAEALAERHPSYPLVSMLLHGRWATMMLLALFSRVAGVEPYQFELFVSILWILIAFAPIAIWSRWWMGMARTQSLLVAFVICTGFWGQFVIDVRADAHQNSVPIMVAFGTLVLWLSEGDERPTPWRGFTIAGIVGAALLFVYPEVFPFVALGCVVFIGIRAWNERGCRRTLPGWLLTAAVLLACGWPLRRLLIEFASSQLRYALRGANTWDQAYFPWLYDSPLAGLWGFAPIVAARTELPASVRGFFVVVGLILTMALVAAILRVPQKLTKAGIALSAALSVAALVQAGYLLMQGQRWAAGKGISYGVPFMILAVAGLTSSAVRSSSSPLGRAAASVAAAAAVIFVVTQSGLAFVRPLLAIGRGSYSGYMINHGEYRRHDWDLRPIVRVLDKNPGAIVWSGVSNPWLDVYLSLVIGWQAHVIQLGPKIAEVGLRTPVPRPSRSADYVIVDRGGSAARAAAAPSVLATTSELALVRPEDGMILIAVDNPNGVDGAGGSPFYWMGGPSTRITLLAAETGCGRLETRFFPGPSLPGVTSRILSVTTSADRKRTEIVGPGPHAIDFRVTFGLNEMELHIEDRPTASVPGDARPLLLGMEAPTITAAACSGTKQ